MKSRLILVLFSALGLAASSTRQRPLEEFFREFTAEWIRSNPNLAAATRFFTGQEQQELERQITPLTREWRLARVNLAERGLTKLRTFSRSEFSNDQRLSAELMEWQLDEVIRRDRHSDYYFPFEQFAGANVTLVMLMTVSHPVVTEGDAENYVTRLRQIPRRMEEAVAEAQRQADLGFIPPRFILRTTVGQMQQFITLAPAQNPLVASFAARMTSASAIAEARREPLRAEAESIVASEIYPAWKKALALLERLEPKATNEAGLWRFTDGPSAYAEALRRFTTTNLSADEIHEIGLREVARLENDMDVLLRKLKRTEGTVKQRVERLRKDLGYPVTEEGRAQIMSDVDQFIREAESHAASLFDRRPKASVIARPFQRFQEATAAANYTPPARDGSRPGIFQMPLRPERMTRFGLRTLVYHETVPGHHFQLALELENEGVPEFRRFRAFGITSALSEGWALYAERLAAESGWYENDIEGQLGQLDALLFRARRLVVDTGLHAKRWTRQQAIDYGIEAAEVERYVVLPGQACAYMIGQLKIIQLREKAQAALGDRFSMREFHNTVLGTGSVPLELLERQVDRYIHRARAPQPHNEL